MTKQKSSDRKLRTTSRDKSRKTRHYFFPNPYEDCAFTRCPKCKNKTKIRKFPLVIHIEPQQLFCLNKVCRYCTKCDLIIVKKSEVEALMAARFESKDPSIIGNKYLVFGTLDRSDWRQYSKLPGDPSKVVERVFVFKDVLNFELIPMGWHSPD